MDRDKERQEIALIGRVLSMEGLMFLMGCASLIHGLVTGDVTSLALGVLVMAGLYVLFKRSSAGISRKGK